MLRARCIGSGALAIRVRALRDLMRGLDLEPHVVSSLVVDDEQLATACTRWSMAGVIGLDTEFVRERTYHPRPGLIQVADRAGVVIVDPLDISDFGPLARLLDDASVTKVMHAADEDLEVLELLTGVTPRGLFDTQLAAAFAGYGFSLSYCGLVDVLLHVALDKGETRSDWLRRPLSPSQLRYAALDVAYLLPIQERLSRELETLGRRAWFAEELEHRRRARLVDRQPDAAYLRVRRRGSLSPASHRVLRALSQWREAEAMSRDIPRRHLMSDEVLIALASDSALAASSIAGVQGLSRRAAARYGPAIMSCIDAARQQDPEDTDAPVSLKAHADTMKRLKEVASTESDARNLPVQLVANRRALESLLVSVITHGGDTVPPPFQGWRFEVVTRPLLDCLASSQSQTA